MTRTERVVRLLFRILSNSNTFSKAELARFFEISPSSIKEDIELIRNIGISVEVEKRPPYRYTIVLDKSFRALEYLQPLSEADRGKVKDALYRLYGEKEVMYIEGKLANLYNFQELGLRALRRPALDKIDNLNLAMKERKRVVLKNYRSNSGTLKDRLVEPFHLDVELDTLQAFDVEAQETRHYRLARIERVEVIDQKWQGGSYIAEKTDVFRIVNNEQVMVHLKLKAQAHNYLTEQYPKSISEIHPSSEPQTWDFEARVNRDFLGLSNFILANAEHIEIVYPQALKEHIKQKAQALLKKLE